MSPDPKAEQERDDFDYDPPRSIFAATWFRALLVLIVVGVIGAIAVPWALDWMNPPPTTATAAVQSAPLPVAVPPASPPAEEGSAAAPIGAVVAAAPTSESAATPAPSASSAPATAVPAPAPEPAPVSTSAADEPPAPDKVKPVIEAPAKKPARAARTVAQAAPAATAKGSWWVQVGAFKDAQTAQRVAEKLRAESFQVQETTLTRTRAGRTSQRAPAAGATNEQYDVFVSGVPATELAGKLTTKGLASEPSGAGVVVRPSLPLRDAVALSKDLASEGLKVQVRRAGGDAGVSPSAAPAATGNETLHRVRVGSFSDRAAAVAAMRELESKGFKGFLAKGGS